MKKEEIEAIKKDAAENWDGDLRVAAAANLYGENVVRRCGGKIPPFADRKKVSALVKELTAKPENNKKPVVSTKKVSENSEENNSENSEENK